MPQDSEGTPLLKLSSSNGETYESNSYENPELYNPSKTQREAEEGLPHSHLDLLREHSWTNHHSLEPLSTKCPQEVMLTRSCSGRSNHVSRTSRSLYGTLSTERLSFGDSVERITLSWEGVNVYAPPPGRKICCCKKDKDVMVERKQILNNVSGVVEPGTCLAIMGASGAGKTTLLNVLTYRNRGPLQVEGSIRVNGGRIGKGMSSMSAYVQQDDLLIGTLTVREHLWFQSQLRMDKEVPKHVREQRVRIVMKEMGLSPSADTFIGIPGKIKGISGGERKRLAFASEVLTNPPLMFCDEPTSGLDSFMAQNVVQTLRNMATKGRTILCTIHQPSSEVFALFDRLLLMAPGGRVAYLGPAKEALDFFKQCGYPCPANYNPADHYIQTLAKVPGKEDVCIAKTNAICDLYKKTAQADDVIETIRTINNQGDDFFLEEEAFADVSPYKESWMWQFYAVFWRCWLNGIRQPEVIRTRLAQTLVLALIFGLTYWGQGHDINQRTINNINGVLFIMQTQMTFGFTFAVIQCFPEEFPIFLREHYDGMYRVDVYFLCKTFAELPQFVFIPALFSIIMYWFVGLYPSPEAFLINTAVMILMCNVSVSLGYLLSSSSSNVSFVLALGPIFIVPCMMIGGFYINTDTIPVYFQWLKYVSWFTYANQIVVVNQWQNIPNITCDYGTSYSFMDAIFNVSGSALSLSPDTSKCIQSGQEVIESFGYQNVELWFSFLMLLVLMVGFRLVAFILLFLRSRQSFKDNKA